MTSATQPVSASGRPLHAMRANSQRLSIDSSRPYVGIVGVLLGAIMSTLGTRVTTLGLADLRGGLHVGFDQGAWMTTSFGVGQMLIGVCCPYLGDILGVRRVLLPAWHHRFLHVEPARAGFPEFTSFFSDAVFVWSGFWNLHSPFNGVHHPKFADAAHHLWCRDLRDEF